MKPLFVKGPYIGYRMLVCGVLALLLMFADHRYRQMDQVRSGLTLLITPIQWLVDVPTRVWSWADATLSHRDTLLQENKELRAQALILSRRVQKIAALTVENVRLRELLNASEKVDERVLLAELIGVDPDPFTYHVIINRGRQHGVFVGQPVLDATGLMGQVIAVSAYTSRVLLVADASHAIPVEVSRNGVRAVALGTGSVQELRLAHVSDTTDIRVDDLLVTSGLGGRFPPGYPVAVVTEVRHDPGRPFAIVKARPTAQLDRSRNVLLVFYGESARQEAQD